MQPLQLFLTESIPLLFLESHLWSPLKDHQEMRDIFDMAVWKVGVLQHACSLFWLQAWYIFYILPESHFASLLHCFRAQASAALHVRESCVGSAVLTSALYHLLPSSTNPSASMQQLVLGKSTARRCDLDLIISKCPLTVSQLPHLSLIPGEGNWCIPAFRCNYFKTDWPFKHTRHCLALIRVNWQNLYNR